jgi:hypothetical protein
VTWPQWAEKAGDGHVDILVNNVGTAPAGPTESATEAEFDPNAAHRARRRSYAFPCGADGCAVSGSVNSASVPFAGAPRPR